MQFIKTNMFYTTSDHYQYNTADKAAIDGNNIYFPLEVDSEYFHTRYNINSPVDDISKTLTLQCRSLDQEQGIIFDHPDNSRSARYKVFEAGFIAVDYLNLNGYETRLVRQNRSLTEKVENWIHVQVISYFAVAELFRMFQGDFLEDIKDIVSKSNDSRGIVQERRVRTYTKIGNHLANYIELPWTMEIEGFKYKVRLEIVDTGSIHGNSSYKDFCGNSGIELKYKDNFNKIEKGMMDKMYSDRADDFENYALGDLYNHQALMGNAENFKHIYASLGLSEYYTIPKLTIGSTISRLFTSVIKKMFHDSVGRVEALEKSENALTNIFCKYGTADWLKRKSTTTACLNAKVDGGRCRNNRPIETTASGVLCDIDISGCYGEGLRAQIYPLGKPVLIDYPVNSPNNQYLTLREFWKTYEHKFLPGLWQARVSTLDGKYLEYPQDYLASWFPPRDMSKMVTDTEFAADVQWWEVDNVGEIKILTNEVKHALITHDFMQWLFNVASQRQRKELLDNLYVETSLHYPADDRVESLSQLVEEHLKHKGRNRTFADRENDRTRKLAIEEECHKWYGIDLGNLIVDALLKERKKYPKGDSFNNLYKLCVNTLYGDMVSPFFRISNVVVGNNITARARALAWCMEKGLHGWQSITDGCAFDVNYVLYPRRSDRNINGLMVVDIYAESNLNDHTFKPLSTADYLCVTDNIVELSYKQTDDATLVTIPTERGLLTLSESDALKWVNNAAFKHLQRLFPNLDVLHKSCCDVYGKERIGLFEFEAKSFWYKASFHGSANYASYPINSEPIVKMRSYSKKDHRGYVLEEDGLKMIGEDLKPAELFLTELLTPKSVSRGHICIKERILKLGEYRKNFDKWRETKAFPGCTIEIAALLHEFSLSQFTFRTKKQFDSWRSEYVKLLRMYNQSYEMYFLNEDGTLNYQQMVETVDRKIREGKHSLFDGLSKRRLNLYRHCEVHREAPCLEAVRYKLHERYHGLIDGDRQNYDDFSDM